MPSILLPAHGFLDALGHFFCKQPGSRPSEVHVHRFLENRKPRQSEAIEVIDFDPTRAHQGDSPGVVGDDVVRITERFHATLGNGRRGREDELRPGLPDMTPNETEQRKENHSSHNLQQFHLHNHVVFVRTVQVGICLLNTGDLIN